MSSLEDMRFLSDEPEAQWEGADYQERLRSGRPALTLDKLGQFTRQVVNQIRMNTPSINVIPAKDADEETAMIFKGNIKNIEYKSNADDAYDTAVLYSVRSGLGWIRVDHDYTDDDGFEQELQIKRVVNNLAVYIDSDSIEPDGSDAKYGFVVDKMRVRDYKAQYPNAECVGFAEDDPLPDDQKDDDFITVVEYFRIVEEEKDLKVGTQERKVKKRYIKRCKMSGAAEPLEETTFPGKYIPLVPVYGEEFWVNGKRYLLSLIRKAKGAQQLHNWWKSLEAEILMKQPEAPFVVAAGQVEEWADDWQQPGKAAVLRYNHLDKDGNPLPAPQRVAPPQTPMGIFNAGLATVDDIKAALGMYNSSIGQGGNETSGIAIQRRKQEGEVGQFHFADNLSKSIAHVGRILVFAMPEIYDTERVINIIGDEDDTKEVGINGAMVEGQKRKFDLRKGRYDVRVITGNSFTTMRQESAEFFTQVVTQQPQLMQVIGDLAFKYMDIPGAQAISNRLRKTIPAQLLEGEDGQEEVQAPDPEKMQMAQLIEQGQGAIQQMEAQIVQLEEQLKNKQQENMIKAQSEVAKTETERMKLELEARKLQIEEQKVALEAIRVQNEVTASQAQPQEPKMPDQIGIKLDTSGFQMMKTPEQLALEEQEQMQEAQVEAVELQMKQQDLAIQQAGIEQSRVNAEAILNALDSVKGSLDNLALDIRKPKTILRDENGLIKGVE